jgi:hypothetical protein
LKRRLGGKLGREAEFKKVKRVTRSALAHVEFVKLQIVFSDDLDFTEHDSPYSILALRQLGRQLRRPRPQVL